MKAGAVLGAAFSAVVIVMFAFVLDDASATRDYPIPGMATLIQFFPFILLLGLVAGFFATTRGR